MDLRLFVLIGIVACAIMVITYYNLALKNGWPVGSFFQPNRMLGAKIFIAITAIYFCIAAGIDYGWYYSLITPVVAFFIAFIMNMVFKIKVQWVSLIGFFVLLIVNILIQIQILPI
jgi:hypothetical protein